MFTKVDLGFYLQRDAIKVNIAKNLNYENINLEKAITLINKKEVEEQESKKKGKKKKGKK